MRRLLIAFGFSLAFAGPALANPTMTATDTQMRASPSSHARVVQSIPANAEIDVSGCGAVWCSASWRDINGFVRASALSAAPPPAPHPVYGPGPPPGVVIAPPVVFAPFGFGYYGWGWGHPWRY